MLPNSKGRLRGGGGADRHHHPHHRHYHHHTWKKRVDMLTIGASASCNNCPTAPLSTPDNEVPSASVIQPRVVTITGRMHPGETPASFVLQGLINFLLSQHPVAQTLRDYVTFKIIPMVNPDGVFLGNYRSNLLGSDLNRSWNKTSQWTHPVLYALKKVIIELDRKTDEIFDLYLDVHAHSALLGSFIYGNMYDDVYRLERHLLFPKLLSQVADDFSLDNTIYNRDPLKAGTGRRYLCGVLNNRVNCYTLEISFHGYHQRLRTVASQASKMPKASPATSLAVSPGPVESGPIVPYTQESYMNLGRNVAKAILEYYKSIGHIPVNLPQPPSSSSGALGDNPRRPTAAAPSSKGLKSKRGGRGGSEVGVANSNVLTRGSFLPGAGSIAVTDTMLKATGTQALPKRVDKDKQRLIAASELPLRSI